MIATKTSRMRMCCQVYLEWLTSLRGICFTLQQPCTTINTDWTRTRWQLKMYSWSTVGSFRQTFSLKCQNKQFCFSLFTTADITVDAATFTNLLVQTHTLKKHWASIEQLIKRIHYNRVEGETETYPKYSNILQKQNIKCLMAQAWNQSEFCSATRILWITRIPFWQFLILVRLNEMPFSLPSADVTSPPIPGFRKIYWFFDLLICNVDS